MMIDPDEIGNGMPPVIDVTEKELATAQAAWQAYRSSTPEACVDLLQQDLSALPMLKPVLLDLLTELPSTSSGLGASEMRMLEMIGRGYSLTDDLFDNSDIRQTYVFDELEYGYLLDGLAFGPKPAVVGLDEALRTMPQENLEDRQESLQAQPPVAHRFRQGRRGPQGRLFPPQPDRPLVGRHAPHQRQSLALEPGAGEAVAGWSEFMSRLILTFDDSASGALKQARLADRVLAFATALCLGAVADGERTSERGASGRCCAERVLRALRRD